MKMALLNNFVRRIYHQNQAPQIFNRILIIPEYLRYSTSIIEFPQDSYLAENEYLLLQGKKWMPITSKIVIKQ